MDLTTIEPGEAAIIIAAIIAFAAIVIALFRYG